MQKVKSEKEKLLIREKAAERKRRSRALKGMKKRCDMTDEELTHVRELDRSRQKRRRSNISIEEKEIIKIKDKKAKQRKRDSFTQAEKEKVKTDHLIQKRKYRLLQSEKSKTIARYKAKEGMRVLRKEGPIRKFLYRTKRHLWTVKWRRFLSQNPIYRELEEKKG